MLTSRNAGTHWRRRALPNGGIETVESRLTRRGKLIVFWILAIALTLAIARFFSVLSPILWALISAYIATPIVTVLVRLTHLPRTLVAIVTYLGIMAVIIFGIITLVPVVQQQGRALINEVPQTTEAAIDLIYERYPQAVQQLDLDRPTIHRGINELTNQVTSRAPQTALTVAQGLFHFVIELFVYLMATFFFLVQGERFMTRLRGLVPPRYQHEANRVLGEINNTIGAYLRGQLLLIVIMSTLTYIALSILNIPFTLALAIATGCLELIPLLGPWSAGAIAVTVAAFAATPPFGWSNLTLAVVVAVVYLTLRQMEDILIIPTLIGRIVHLHPLLVIVFVLIGTSIGGILGLLLAVPVAAVMRILIRYLYGKLTAQTERRVVRCDTRIALLRLQKELPDMTNINIVSLVQPGVLTLDDLSLAQGIAALATYHGVDLEVVTTDPLAGSLFTAAGVTTQVIATSAASDVATLPPITSSNP